jgi:hypothetical protein
MHVFSVANGKVGYEPISKEQAAILSASPRGPEQKQAVKKWFRENVA